MNVNFAANQRVTACYKGHSAGLPALIMRQTHVCDMHCVAGTLREILHQAIHRTA